MALRAVFKVIVQRSRGQLGSKTLIAPSLMKTTNLESFLSLFEGIVEILSQTKKIGCDRTQHSVMNYLMPLALNFF